MNAGRKSDGSIKPAKPANKGGAEPPAEPVEGRDPAKKNAEQDASHRTPCRIKRESRGLQGVREAARKDSTLVFTALLHHVDKSALRAAFLSLKKAAATGVDGMTWHEYEQEVETNIAGLHGRYPEQRFRARLKAGAV